jgi:parallel beta-helix repeat protein
MKSMKPIVVAILSLVHIFALTGLAANCGDGIKTCACGDTVTANYTMTANLGPCSGHGLRIASNVVLGCNDFMLTGSGTSSTSIGIRFESGSGGSANNCKVTKFFKGVRFTNRSGGALGDSEIYDNGLSGQGYGVELGCGAQFNTIQTSIIRNNQDEGIHVGCSTASTTHDNQILDNSVFSNGKEQLYLLNTTNNRIERNVFSGGINSGYIKDSTANVFQSNTFENRPFVYNGESDNNQSIDDDYNGVQLRFQGVSGGKFPDNNTVNGADFSNGTNTCLRFDSARQNLIWQSRFTSCGTDAACTGALTYGLNTIQGSAGVNTIAEGGNCDINVIP